MMNRLPKFAFASIKLNKHMFTSPIRSQWHQASPFCIHPFQCQILCLSNQSMFLKMQLLHPSILFSFLIISIILNQIPTLLCVGDVHILPCSSSFDCVNLQNNTLCDECQKSGGHCGYSPGSGEFTCYCMDGSFPSSCPSGQYL